MSFNAVRENKILAKISSSWVGVYMYSLGVADSVNPYQPDPGAGWSKFTLFNQTYPSKYLG